MIYVNSVSVYPKTITLKVGDWYYYAFAEVCPSDADCKNVTWHSNNSSVASVNASNGYIYANSVGTARIFATATDGSECSDYITVTVKNTVPVSSLTLNLSSITVEEGKSAVLYATVCPENASEQNVHWISSDINVATVTNGLIYAISPGSAVITATARDGSGKSASCTVTVTGDVLVTSISVVPSTKTLIEGNSIFLSTTVCPANATKKSVYWSSSNTNIAIVNENSGLVLALNSGTVTIYATACDGGGVVGCCTVTVIPPVRVECIGICPETLNMNVGDTVGLYAEVFPENATNKTIRWTSENCNIADVDFVTGCVTAKAEGTTYICANAHDGSKICGCCYVTVQSVPVLSLQVKSNVDIDVGNNITIPRVISPSNATNKAIIWKSSDNNIASVNTTSGRVTGKNAGIATITATTVDGGHVSSCEVWVRGKTPVFLIHGRTSNSFGVWGANNSIFTNPLNPDDKDNNHFNPSITAMSIGNTQFLYTNKNTQDIFSYQLGQPVNVNGNMDDQFIVAGVFNGEFTDGKYIEPHPEGGNLAYYLNQKGYKENVNLFVFNYPNEDAVIFSAQKFQKYIENLISFVYNNGTNEMKTCFFESRNAYNTHDFKINLVGHSMGGLISRYYIENLENDNHVKKLITICTPHWGSGYADTSCITGTGLHKLCDHDLRFKSAMYGGDFTTTLNCNAMTTHCYNDNYTLTDELNYSKKRPTKYYAIAAIDYTASNIASNDYTFELPTNLNTYQEIIDYMTEKSVHKLNVFANIVPIDLHDVGDNMVGFLSQIGWTENDASSPSKKIIMEKIFVDIDSNGGNGNNIPGLEMLNMLHNKAPHRMRIMNQINNYLNE